MLENCFVLRYVCSLPFSQNPTSALSWTTWLHFQLCCGWDLSGCGCVGSNGCCCQFKRWAVSVEMSSTLTKSFYLYFLTSTVTYAMIKIKRRLWIVSRKVTEQESSSGTWRQKVRLAHSQNSLSFPMHEDIVEELFPPVSPISSLLSFILLLSTSPFSPLLISYKSQVAIRWLLSSPALWQTAQLHTTTVQFQGAQPFHIILNMME